MVATYLRTKTVGETGEPRMGQDKAEREVGWRTIEVNRGSS